MLLIVLEKQVMIYFCQIRVKIEIYAWFKVEKALKNEYFKYFRGVNISKWNRSISILSVQ